MRHATILVLHVFYYYVNVSIVVLCASYEVSLSFVKGAYKYILLVLLLKEDVTW